MHLTLVLALTAAQPTGGEASRPRTKLQFQWPAGLVCDVEHVVEVEFTQGPRQSHRTTRHYRLEANRVGTEWHVRRTALAEPAASVSGPAGSPSPPLRHPPSFKVEADGSFAGLLVDADQRRQFADQDRQMAATPLEDGPGAEQTAAQTARGDWNALVGGWANAEVALGISTSQKTDHQVDIPVFGPIRSKARERYTWTRRVPCTADATAQCVELESIVEPEVAAINRAMKKFLARAAKQVPPDPDLPKEAKMVSQKTRAVLVTDPSTMVPSRSSTVSEQELAFTPPMEGISRIKIRSERTELFRCKPPK